MSDLVWGPGEEARLAAIRDDLAGVSTATACQLLIALGWRNAYMRGLLPLQALGLGTRLVGRARTVRYLMRRGPEGPHDPVARRVSPEIVLIESLAPGDVVCIDALGVPTAGIIGDILSARILGRGAVAAIIHGAVRDAPFIKRSDCRSLRPRSTPHIAAVTSCPSTTTGRSTWPGLKSCRGTSSWPMTRAPWRCRSTWRSTSPGTDLRKKRWRSGSAAKWQPGDRFTITTRPVPRRQRSTWRRPDAKRQRSIRGEKRPQGEDHRRAHLCPSLN